MPLPTINIHRLTLALTEAWLFEKPANRIEFLMGKYGPALAQALNKESLRYLESDAFWPKLWPQDMFGGKPEDWAKAFVVGVVKEIDPKHGAYSEWIVSTFLKMSDGAQSRLITNWDEDAPKITYGLDLFDRFRPKLKHMFGELDYRVTGQAEPINLITDIRQIGSFRKLGRLVVDFIEPLVQKRDAFDVPAAEVEKLFDQPPWLVVVPKTERASRKYGAGTTWCTAATYHNAFDHYNRQGPLYIFINRKTNEKWHFHFESQQFMDKDDEQIQLKGFAASFPELKPFLFKLGKTRRHYRLMFYADPKATVQEVASLPKEEATALVKGDVLLCAAWGAVQPKEVNALQGWLVFPEKATDPIVVKTSWNVEDFLAFTADPDNPYYKRILNHDEFHDTLDVGTVDSPEEVLGWLDQKNATKFVEWVAELARQKRLSPDPIIEYSQGESGTIYPEEVWRLIKGEYDEEDEANEDYRFLETAVLDKLNDAYGRASERAMQGGMYTDVMDAIYDGMNITKEAFTYDHHDRITIKMTPRQFEYMLRMISVLADDTPVPLNEIMEDFSKGVRHNNDEGKIDFSDYYPAKPHFNEVFSEWSN